MVWDGWGVAVDEWESSIDKAKINGYNPSGFLRSGLYPISLWYVGIPAEIGKTESRKQVGGVSG